MAQEIVTLEKASVADFDTVFAAMEESFIPAERRDRADALALFEDPAYTVYHITRDGVRTGFITVFALEGFAFAEHFVVYAAHRNGGIGSAALGALKSIHPRVILEVEPPETALQARRLAFYKRNGFCENDVPYIQPPYRKGDEGTPLILMSYPAPLSEPRAAIAQIFRHVYNKAI